MILQRLNSLEARIRLYPQAVINETINILNRSTDQIKGFITEELSKGFDAEGKKIGDRKPYKSEKYAQFKTQLNPLPGKGNPDLKLRGNFYDGIKVEVQGQDLVAEGVDFKTPILEARYGDVVGFNPVVRERIVEEILRPQLLVFTQNYFN